MTAAHQHPAVGSWRLISSEATTVDDEGNTEVIVTENPQGYIMFTPWGRMMTVCVGGHSDREKVPTSQADFSDLWKRMLAYTGTYRVEGDELVTNVEISWYPLWAGTEQRRKFTLEGNKLTVVTKPQPMGTGHRAKSMVTCKVVWEREA
ncbi:MAG: lipocalin-like domain-containing protein [Candidatus Acidiferrales bacterium]